MRQSADLSKPNHKSGHELGAFDTLYKLRPYLWPKNRPDLRRRGVLALALLVLSKLIGLTSPYLFKQLTDHFVNVTPGSELAIAITATGIGFIILYGTSRALSVVVAQIRDALFAKVAQNSARELTKKTFQHIHALSLGFHLGRKTGALSRVIERAARGIEVLVRFAVFNAIPVLLEFLILIIIFGTYFDYRYVLVLVGATLTYSYFTFRVSEWRIAIRRRMNEADNKATTRAVDSLLNYETVKYFGNERLELERFDAAVAGYEKAAVSTYISLAWINSGQIIIFSSALALCMVFSVNGIAAGTQTVGDLVMINLFLMQLHQPLNFMGTVYREIRQALLDIGEMFGLLEHDAEIVDKPNAKALKVTGGRIVFDDVRFDYNKDRPVLKGISLSVEPGQKVAIVGTSGAGKSTVSRLLFRFYDVTGGRISIDDQDIRDVSQASLRQAIGMVPQDTVLFNDTIGYNILYGRPDATQAEIEAVAKMARIHDFIMALPDQYDALVGERGLKLSGGEKQRVSIARTMLKAPPILILDEATSALDTDTEKDIQAAINSVAEGRTIIVIAHRLSTVIDADQIIVLDDGRIIERGTHSSLLARDNGRYATLWRRQLEVDEAQAKIIGALADGVVRRENNLPLDMGPV